MLKKCFFLIALVFLISVAAWAQFEGGSVVGIVQDTSGSVIPNAHVEVRSLATDVTRQATTTAAGGFDFVALEPGNYTITVTQQGFRDATQKFELTVGQRLQLNMTMQVGSATQQVVVNAQVETLDTASSDVSNLRTTQQVVDLPLNARDFTQLVQLAPGVDNHGNSTNSSNGGYTEGRGTSGAIVDGNPPEISVYLFDGIQSMDSDANVLIFYPPVDSIQEFEVQTSNAPAAYGGSPYVINVTTRSGTNSYHGVFYEFVRNSDFDAKNYFDLHANPIPPFHMNQFGANVGGPVILPHLFNGKDKLFFFGDYEGKRQSQAQTYVDTVPIPAFLTGNFSALLPGTVLHVPGNPAVPLPGNQVQQINPTSANLIALYPAPNIPGAGIVNNYVYNGALSNVIDQGDVRIDYRTVKSAILGRFSIENADTISPGYLPSPAVGGGPSYPGTTVAPGKQVVLGYGRSIGSNKYYEARLGYSRLTEKITDEDQALGDIAEKLGIPNANAGGATGLTGVKISGTATVGDAGDGGLQKINNNWELSQALSWIVRNHEIKFGVDLMSRRFAFFSPANPVGTYSFTGGFTGYGLADFLYGVPVTSELDVSKFFSMKRYQPAWYIQDNWRLTTKLTLNLGLRDDLVTPWVERDNRLAGFVPTGGGNLVVVGTAPYYGNTITVGRYTNFGPRFGFAYSVNSKTVVRGGGGIFYAFETNNSNPQAKNAPFNGSFVETNSTTAGGFASALKISDGFPAERTNLFPTAGTSFNVFQRRYPNPSANEWNLNIQRQFTSSDVLSVAYVGQTGVHILANTNINQPVPGPGSVTPRRPFPNLSDGTDDCVCGNSIYSSLQATYRMQLGRALDLLAAYTYGHSIDNTSGNSTLVAPQDPYDRALFRGNSDFDVRQDLVLSWSYQLPFGSGKTFASSAKGVLQQVVGGWQLNSIDTFQTGSPFTPVMTTSLLNAGSAVQWPNRIGSGKLSHPTPKAWFNTADFVSPGNYTYGNSGRNILFGPGTKQFDLSLFKNFGLSSDGERHLQLRAETFNIFNTPQFNNPNAQIGNAAAGTITSAGQPQLYQRTSRQIQIAGKLYW